MDEAQVDSNEGASQVGGGPNGEDPEPEDKKKGRTSEIKMTTALETDKENETKEMNENMIFDEAAVEQVSE